MLGGELCWRDAAANAARPDLVAVRARGCDLGHGLCQCFEPVLVQALVTQCAVEALGVGVLLRPPRQVHDVGDTSRLCPRHQRSAGAPVRSDGL